MAKIISEASEMLATLGVPLEDMTKRNRERVALAIAALGGITSPVQWQYCRSQSDGVSLRSRDIIRFMNEHYYAEPLADGSYDDIRRKDLVYPVLLGIVARAIEPDADINDGTRGYALSDAAATVFRTFGTPDWERASKGFAAVAAKTLAEIQRMRESHQVPITLPSGLELLFSAGDHNLLQKAIIEEFLPRYGFSAEVLYVGDTAKKLAVLDEARLNEIGFFEINRAVLPDVVAYSKDRGWLYLIEAVYASGPVSPEKRYLLAQLCADVPVGIIYVTAFQDRPSFKKWATDIGWETEVWIADEPDHLIHFDGERFLGPYG